MGKYYNTTLTEIEKKHIVAFFERMKITTYKISDTDSADKFDATFTNSTGKLFIIEAKVRNYTSSDLIHSTNPFIEIKKLKALVNHAILTNRIPLYVNFTNDNKALVFNLSEYIKDGKLNAKLVKENMGERLMNRSTVISTTDKVLKKVIELQFSYDRDKVINDIFDLEVDKPRYKLTDLHIQVLPDGKYEINIIKEKIKVDNIVLWLLENKIVSNLEEAKTIRDSNTTINIMNFLK